MVLPLWTDEVLMLTITSKYIFGLMSLRSIYAFGIYFGIFNSFFRKFATVSMVQGREIQFASDFFFRQVSDVIVFGFR